MAAGTSGFHCKNVKDFGRDDEKRLQKQPAGERKDGFLI